MSEGFEGFYSGSYEGTYAGAYAGYYSTGYEGSVVDTWVGVYSGQYEGSYEAAYAGEYTQSYLGGEFQGLYSGQYTGPFGGGAPGTSYRLYSGVYSGTYDAEYVAAYEGQYTGSFEGLYSGGGGQVYSEGYYVGSYEGAFSSGFIGQYSGNYDGSYTGSYDYLWGAFSGQYTGTFSSTFSGNYSTAFLGTYDASYVTEYVGMYSGQYEGSYEASYEGFYSTAYAGTYSLNIGDTVVTTTKTHHGKPETTVVHSSTGSVEVTTGGTSTINKSQSAGKDVITRIASNDTIVHLGIVDLENLTVDLKPKAVSAGEKAPGLGTSDRPFGDLFLQGNTLTLSTRSISITESGGAEYIDFGANTIIGATQVTGDRLLAFADQLKITGLTDVSLAGLNDGNILKWSVSQNKWIPGTPSTIESLQLYQLEDVDTAGLLNGYVLKWNALINKWEVGDPAVATSVDLSTSDIGDLGNVTKIAYPHSSVFQYNTIESRWKAVAPDSINFEELTSGTLTVNTEVVYSTTRTVQATAGEVVADSFNINTYRSAKYIITCEDYTTDNKGYWTGEIILAHDGTNAVITVFGEVEIGDQSMNPIIAADISSGNVRLKVTTTSDQQVVTSHRSVITKYT